VRQRPPTNLEEKLLILVVDDEPDVKVLFRQRFRRDLRAGRFAMEFAQSAPMALKRITDAAGASLILILSDINMPGMSGLELLPKAKALRPDVPIIMITAYGDAETKRQAVERGAEVLGRSVAKSICALSAHNLAQFAAVHESGYGPLASFAAPRDHVRDGASASVGSSQQVGNAARPVRAAGIEGRFPDRDLATAHDPDLDAMSAHG
jgi:CheY-like chemotaxis protein